MGLQKPAILPTRMLKRPLLLAVVFSTICGFCSIGNVAAQDPAFTQFYANPLYLNPAMAGSNKCPRVVLNYRNQWPGLDGSYITSSASYDQYIDAIQGGLGIQVLSDNAGRGTYTTFAINAMYSYQLNITDEISMLAGFQAGYFQKSLDWSKLTFGDMIDARRGFIYETMDVARADDVDNVDFAAGLMVFNETFYGGVAVHHLFEPNESVLVQEAPLERKYTAHAGAVIPINKDIKGRSETSVSPNVLYQYQYGTSQLNLGLYVQKGPLIGGVWYRFDDALILLAGVETEFFKVGYSFDLTTSALATKTSGSHEISAAFTFNCRTPKKKLRAINCPSF